MARAAKKPPNRGTGWEVKKSFFKITGDRKQHSFYSSISYQDALDKAEQYKSMLMAHILVGYTYISRECTFKEWAETWLETYKENKVKESTYLETYERTVKSYLIPYFGNRRINTISETDIEKFVKEQSSVYSDSVMKKMRLCLRGIFRTAIKNHLCNDNPVDDVSFDSNVESVPKRTYSQDEVDKILAFSDTHKYGLYIRILLELGLRCSELCGLKWGDIDYKDKSVFIQRATTAVKYKAVTAKPKSKKSIRHLPLSTEMLNCFEVNRQDNKRFILESSKIEGKPLTPLDFSANRYKTFFSDFQKHLAEEHKKKLQEDANAKPIIIANLTPHELRHTCGTLLYARTKDIYAVSKYLGHSSVEITARLYVHESADLLRSNLGIK